MKRAPFQDNVAIVTGASAGIGRELAVQLAEQGARLCLAARDLRRLETVAAECIERGGQALPLVIDVAEHEQCRQLIDRAVQHFGRLDTLINNAGISMWVPFAELQDLGVIEQIMRVNYLGAVYCTYYALPHLRRSRGRLVAVSSLTGKTGVPTRSGYAASKHAVAGFFDTLRIELGGSGVTVTVVYPDFVATDIRRRALGADGRPLGKSPVREDEVMSAVECARRILAAAAGRRREVIMSARGKLGLWLKLLAPGILDRIASRAVSQGR